MKIGNIAKPNDKGQIVIPRETREQLGITENTPLNIIMRGHSVCMYPISSVTHIAEDDPASFLKVLEKTRGSWKQEDWGATRKKRQRIERSASRRRKHAW